MRILHLSSEYPPQKVFGLGRFVYDLAGAQAAAGDEVCVVTNSFSGERYDIVERGVRVARVHFPPPPKPAEESATVMQFNTQVLERAAPIIEQWRPDVINVHDWLTAAAGEVLKAVHGLPLVMTVHDTVMGKSFGELDNERKFIGRIEEWICRRADRVIANSSWVKRELVDTYGAPPGKVGVTPCAVDVSAFAVSPDIEHLDAFRRVLAQPDEPIVLYVGRLDPEKGLEVLMNALPGVLARCPKAKIVLAGRGRMQESLQQHLEKNRLLDRVFFAGYVRPPALALLYHVADVQVVPSTYEPFGIVALEGMAAGKAVVASSTGGLSDIVEHRKTGLLVKPGSHEELAESLVAMLIDPDRRRRFGLAGRDRAEKVFNWARVAAMTREVYGKACRGEPIPEEPWERAKPRPPVVAATSSRPQVLFDCQQLSEQTTGLGRYSEEVLKAVLAQDLDHEWVLLCHSENASYVERLTQGRRNARLIVLKQSVSLDWRVQQDMLSGLIPREKVGLYFSPAFLSVPPDLCPTISVVHDVTYHALPKGLFPKNFPEYMHACVTDTCRNAARIITVSEHSRQDIARVYGYPPERIAVTHLAADREFFKGRTEEAVAAARRKHGLPGRYILMVNVGSPKKNFGLLLDAYAKLPKELRKDVKLVGAGAWPPEVDLPKMVRATKLGKDAILTGQVPTEDLFAVYAGAELFCFPSLHEGFGLPVLEAMASGVPVVCSNVTSLPEVAGDAAVLLDPKDAEAWARAISELLGSPEKRAEMAKRGKERAAEFHWEKTAKRTLEVIREVVGTQGSPSAPAGGEPRQAPRLSGCTIVRNAVKLGYPLEASIRSYLPVCDEVVVAYDPKSEDGTEGLVLDLARRYPKVRPLASPWNMANHEGGTEIAIQSNMAIQACSGQWVLYVQADEAVHEGCHAAIRQALGQPEICGAVFTRRSFMGTLDREIPEYRRGGLLRLFRRGLAQAAGDAMSCAFLQKSEGKVVDLGAGLFNYSRMGSREEVIRRAESLHGFYHQSADEVRRNLDKEFKQETAHFDPAAHPAAVLEQHGREWMPAGAAVPCTFPVTLGFLLGSHERENIQPFLWQFRGWPGDIVVFDDQTPEDCGELVRRTVTELLGIAADRLQIVRRPLGGDFAAARNLVQELARSQWVLHADPDERWDPGLIRSIREVVAQLDRDGKRVCCLPCANFLDGVLVNDLPDSEWTEEGLRRTTGTTSWPPRNRDVHARLMRRDVKWGGKLHESPAANEPRDRVAYLPDAWILHAKSLARQRTQDLFYRSLGQKGGMPHPEMVVTLREKVLAEAMGRLPKGPITIVETGTIRDASPAARRGDGWSTLHLARLLSIRNHLGGQLYSIDINPDYIETSKKIVDPELHPWVTWICSDSRKAIKELSVEAIDLLYLDSADDPKLILEEFEAAESKLSARAVVVVDDTGQSRIGPMGKGSLLLPELELRGWRVEDRHEGQSNMAVAFRVRGRP
ncbi:MAG TPA: glycosyltransferase [Planctomycetota bacterium]|nr:glycosyltransferase [Planctomycetota bacterium]